MNILYIVQYFYPETNAAANRTLSHAKCLSKHHNIQVLTGLPNHPKAKLFDGYKSKFFQKRTVENIPVFYSYEYIPKNLASFKQRIFNYFTASCSIFINYFRIKNKDLIIASSPPLTILVTAYILAKLTKKKLIIEIRDVWPQAILKTTNTFLKILEFFENKAYKYATKVVINSPGLKTELLKHKKIDENKIIYIPNGINIQEFNNKLSKASIDTSFMENKFIITFSGLIGFAQNMDVLVNLAKQVEKYPEILILIIGTGPKYVDLQEKTKNIHNIKLLGYIQQEDLYKVLTKSDILLISLKNDKNYTKNIPSKIYDYLASKKPIVVNIPGSCQEIIAKYNCGLYNTEFNDQMFINNIINLYQNKDLRDKITDNINNVLTKIEINNIIQK